MIWKYESVLVVDEVLYYVDRILKHAKINNEFSKVSWIILKIMKQSRLPVKVFYKENCLEAELNLMKSEHDNGILANVLQSLQDDKCFEFKILSFVAWLLCFMFYLWKII